MARFRIDTIESLARQLSFAPVETRSAQLSAAEALLLDLDPVKAYPLEFVVFRITGYRPKTASEELLTGLALQHDLGLLIEQVSDGLQLSAGSAGEPVLQIDDLTSRFNVTSKTIQRWRRRGLPARRFEFADGRKRVGFLLSTVERFLATHEEQVDRGTNFSQVSDSERIDIVRRARRLAVMCQCCESEIARRIARKLNRSPLTIKYTIRKHDQDHPGDAIFAQAAKPLAEDERGRILKAFRRGLPLDRLARRACRPRSAVYRVIVEERIERINRRKVKFISDELYHRPDAEQMLQEMQQGGELAAGKPSPDETRVPRDLPPYLQELYRTPLLTPAQERALFLTFNYHKFRFVQSRRRLDPQFARARELNELEGHLRRASDVKNQIVRANLRLVVSVARKHLRTGINLMDLISDGNMTLLRAVESFDTHRGFRFSTYATLALMKAFARSVPLLRAASMSGSTVKEEMLAALPDRNASAFTRDVLVRDEVQKLLSRLSSREREIVESHFGVDRAEPASYDELSVRLGLTKSRIRQIEQAALEKLRALHA